MVAILKNGDLEVWIFIDFHVLSKFSKNYVWLKNKKNIN